MTSRGVRAETIELVPYDQVDLDAWHRLRESVAELDSPYFHPGFAGAVHATGRAVQVVVVKGLGGEVTGLLPVHRHRSTLSPVGWPAADFQGPLLAPGASFPVRGLLTGGVKTFTFDHLATGLADFAPWTESCRISPYLDVSGGLDDYLGRASRSGREHMRQARRQLAKAERSYGRVTFTADDPDPAALARVIELKREQYAATGARDYFSKAERVDLMSRLLHTRTPDFGGVLSTLYAGPYLIAAHFGLRSGPVLHWWFPAYDPMYARFAPGWMLLREFVIAAPGLGIARIDLGRGEDGYKRWAKTGETTVYQGIVTCSLTRKTTRAGVAAIKSSPMAPQARRLMRSFRARR